MEEQSTASSGWLHLETALWDVIAPTWFIVLIVFAIVYVPALLSSQFRLVPGKEATLLSFCVLGAVLGVFVGASKTPVVGTLLPAMLTFMSGLLAYLFSRENLAIWRPLIPLAMIGLLSTALAGAFVGSGIRSDHEKFEREYKEWFVRYEQVQLPIEKEMALKALEANDQKAKRTDKSEQ